jgi:solute carrier family 25 citrate transporter 1
MQSLSARTQYKNSFHCGYRIFTEEGITKFWKGTTPRLARLIVSRSGVAAFLFGSLFELYS